MILPFARQPYFQVLYYRPGSEARIFADNMLRLPWQLNRSSRPWMVGSGLILVCAHGDPGRLMDGKSREFQDLALQFNVRSTDTCVCQGSKRKKKR